MAAQGSGAGIADAPTSREDCKVGLPLLRPRWSGVPDPKQRGQAEDGRDQEGLQGALAVEPSGEEKVEPHQSRILRLDGQRNGQAEDAGRYKPVAEEAPDGNRAEADNDPGRVGGDDEQFAVDEEQADERAGSHGRVLGRQAPDQDRRKDEAGHGEHQPENVRRAPGHQREGNREAEGGGQIDVAGGNLADFFRVGGVVATRGPIKAEHLGFVVRVAMLNQAARGVIHHAEVHQGLMAGALQGEAQKYKDDRSQQQQHQAVAPCSADCAHDPPRETMLYFRVMLRGLVSWVRFC